MKKLMICAALLILLPAASMAQTFDGIWKVDGQNAFFSVHENADLLIGFTFIPGAGESVFIGSSNGATANITFSTDVLDMSATVSLNSASTGDITIHRCTPFPGSFCIFPTGATLGFTRIF